MAASRPASQTCWFANVDGSELDCIASGAGKVGDACRNTAGEATCSDGLMCLELEAGGPGVCSAYCDLEGAKHGCPAGSTCTETATSSGLTFAVGHPTSATGTTSGGAPN